MYERGRERERERERGGVRGYKCSCRLVNIVMANANIPRLSIEAKMGIFTVEIN